MAVDYELFIGQLRDPKADHLREKLSTFLVDFKQRASTMSLSNQRKAISSFMTGIVQDSEAHLAFLSAQNDYDEENVIEGWEKV
jgi:hypothetical protein